MGRIERMVKKFFYFPMITVTLLLTSCTNVLVHDMEKGGVDGMAIDFRTPALTRVAVESFTAGSSFSVWGWYLPKDAASEVFNATTVSTPDVLFGPMRDYAIGKRTKHIHFTLYIRR